MPIAQDRTPQVQNDLPVNVTPPEYKSAVVDTYRTNLADILVYLEGHSWTTDYYSQVVAEDNQIGPSDGGLDPPYQQYRLIKGYELKVTEPLTHTQNSETNEFEIRGGGTIYPNGVIPNVGDMFLADIGDGREGVFTITASEKKTIFLSAAYAVEYMLQTVNGDAKRQELSDKVVQTLFFKKDFLLHGQNPLLMESEVLSIDTINKHIETIKNYFFDRFYSHEHGTFLVPNQGKKLYDPYFNKAITDLFDNNEHLLLQQVKMLNVHGDNRIKQKTVWDALLTLDSSKLLTAAKEMQVVSTNYWTKVPMMKSLKFSGIDQVVFPLNPLVTVDVQNEIFTEFEGERINDTTRRDPETGDWLAWVDPEPPEPVEGEEVVPVVPLYRPVTLDTFYVFSEAFYTQSETDQSVIEVLANNLLKNVALDMSQLNRLGEEYKNMGLVEQFYYAPVIIILLKVALRKM